MVLHWIRVPEVGIFGGFLVLVIIITLYKCFIRYLYVNANKYKKPSRSRRRLGISEQLMDILSQEKEGSTNISLIITVRSKQRLLEDDVRTALVLLAKRQPMLRAIIRTIPSSSTVANDRYFEIIDGDKISEGINFSRSNVNACEWQNMWRGITSFQRGNGLLWRVVLLQEQFLKETKDYANTLVVGFCHSSVDGVSTVKFCEQFFRYLNEVTAGERSVNDNITSLPLSPAFDDLIVLSRGLNLWRFLIKSPLIGHLLKLIFRAIARLVIYRKQCNPFFAQFPLSQDSITFPKPSQNEITFKVFSTSETERLVKECREHNSTVTGALMAATHLAFCKLIQEGLVYKDIKLEHLFAINGQRNCQPKPHNEYLGDFVFVQSLQLPCINAEKADFWNLAQDATKRIRSTLNSKSHVTKNVVFMDTFDKAEELLEMFNNQDFQTSLKMPPCNFLSSAGLFHFDENHSTYKLHECLYNNLNHGVSGAGVFSHYNVTVNGKMSWLILYDSSKVSAAQAEFYGNLCFGYFDEIIS